MPFLATANRNEIAPTSVRAGFARLLLLAIGIRRIFLAVHRGFRLSLVANARYRDAAQPDAQRTQQCNDAFHLQPPWRRFMSRYWPARFEARSVPVVSLL